MTKLEIAPQKLIDAALGHFKIEFLRTWPLLHDVAFEHLRRVVGSEATAQSVLTPARIAAYLTTDPARMLSLMGQGDQLALASSKRGLVMDRQGMKFTLTFAPALADWFRSGESVEKLESTRVAEESRSILDYLELQKSFRPFRDAPGVIQANELAQVPQGIFQSPTPDISRSGYYAIFNENGVAVVNPLNLAEVTNCAFTHAFKSELATHLRASRQFYEKPARSRPPTQIAFEKSLGHRLWNQDMVAELQLACLKFGASLPEHETDPVIELFRKRGIGTSFLKSDPKSHDRAPSAAEFKVIRTLLDRWSETLTPAISEVIVSDAPYCCSGSGGTTTLYRSPRTGAPRDAEAAYAALTDDHRALKISLMLGSHIPNTPPAELGLYPIHWDALAARPDETEELLFKRNAVFMFRGLKIRHPEFLKPVETSLMQRGGAAVQEMAGIDERGEPDGPVALQFMELLWQANCAIQRGTRELLVGNWAFELVTRDRGGRLQITGAASPKLLPPMAS